MSAQILIFENVADAERAALHGLLRDEMAEKVHIVTDAQGVWDYLNDPANVAEDLVAVFLDLAPSNANSLELLDKIRGDRRLAHLHVIGMTTDDTPQEDMARCIALDVVTYVKKPITLPSFTKAIAESFHSSKTAKKTRA